MLHTGYYLPCRSLTDATLTESLGTAVIIEDTDGNVEELELYNFVSKFNPNWLKPGTIMLIKEPYLKFGTAKERVVIRVDSPSDVVFVNETDEKLLRQANALSWFKSEILNFEELKKKANILFIKKDYECTLEFYERALVVQPETGVIYLNMAAVLLQLDRFYEAYKAAKKALEMNENREKALFRCVKRNLNACFKN